MNTIIFRCDEGEDHIGISFPSNIIVNIGMKYIKHFTTINYIYTEMGKSNNDECIPLLDNSMTYEIFIKMLDYIDLLDQMQPEQTQRPPNYLTEMENNFICGMIGAQNTSEIPQKESQQKLRNIMMACNYIGLDSLRLVCIKKIADMINKCGTNTNLMMNIIGK